MPDIWSWTAFVTYLAAFLTVDLIRWAWRKRRNRRRG